jgi:hypothetical protein
VAGWVIPPHVPFIGKYHTVQPGVKAPTAAGRNIMHGGNLWKSISVSFEFV